VAERCLQAAVQEEQRQALEDSQDRERRQLQAQQESQKAALQAKQREERVATQQGGGKKQKVEEDGPFWRDDLAAKQEEVRQHGQGGQGPGPRGLRGRRPPQMDRGPQDKQRQRTLRFGSRAVALSCHILTQIPGAFVFPAMGSSAASLVLLAILAAHCSPGTPPVATPCIHTLHGGPCLPLVVPLASSADPPACVCLSQEWVPEELSAPGSDNDPVAAFTMADVDLAFPEAYEDIFSPKDPPSSTTSGLATSSDSRGPDPARPGVGPREDGPLDSTRHYAAASVSGPPSPFPDRHFGTPGTPGAPCCAYTAPLLPQVRQGKASCSYHNGRSIYIVAKQVQLFLEPVTNTLPILRQPCSVVQPSLCGVPPGAYRPPPLC
jgi:hypothetical protein